jgi:hypothetical protein
MNSPEVFYLHRHGEQRGPYTIPQIDHLLNSGLISDETLYWREGMDQWHPVTELVVRRVEPNPWKKPAIVVAVLIVLTLLAQIFGPITLTGWRETNQHDFSERAAYWRARAFARESAAKLGAIVEFDGFADARVELKDNSGASVIVRGENTDRGGNTREAGWRVRMKFDPKEREWSVVSVEELAVTP